MKAVLVFFSISLFFISPLPVLAEKQDRINTNGAAQSNKGRTSLEPNPAGSSSVKSNNHETLPKTKLGKKEVSEEKKKKRFKRAKKLKMKDETSKKNHLHL